MFGESLPNNNGESENSQSKLSRYVSERKRENPDEKNSFSGKGIYFLNESEMGSDGFLSNASKMKNSTSQELTLSYMCDNSRLNFPAKNYPSPVNNNKTLLNSFDKKGKEVFVSEKDDKWVERDFLNLNETRGNSSKREVEEEIERENRDKKPKLGALNLSLALPDISLTASNALQDEDPPLRSKPSRSIQSLAPSNNYTQTTCSNDFTAATLSQSYSHPFSFSHNPSCSLTRNSTENYDYSVGRDDQIWNCGEGTNGSVHSRFKPFGDGVALSMMQASNRPANKDLVNGHPLITSSDNHSLYPSELPARPRLDTPSVDLKGKGSDNLRALEGPAHKISRPERILREIVVESIPVMAQIVHELSPETLASTKDYLNSVISNPEKRDELAALQNRLERRSDLSKETLSKCNKDQLEILVAVKLGLGTFISGKTRRGVAELVEIFLLLRCRNCNSVVPVDDCDCRICLGNKGFCSSCMCPICLNFDCANNTCSWVGCDVCSHWCHTACGIQRNLIRPGPSLRGPSGTKEMLFNCVACSHASEMFGFVRDVFVCCAKDWGLKTLMKELDCVTSVFRRSEDYKGKELYKKVDEMLSKLASNMISPSNASNFIIQFFNYADGLSEFPSSTITSIELPATTQTGLGKDRAPLPQQNISSSSTCCNLLFTDHHQNNNKVSSIIKDMKKEDEFRFGTFSKKEGLDSLEGIVRIKEAEASMFQNKADDARREAEGLQRIIIAKTEKLEEEYIEKLSKLGLQETEERRRKKTEELKFLENSHFDYYNMKMRMQSEIAGLLERMEATKKQLV